VEREWRESAIPALVEYVRIPAKSPAFDPQWRAHGHIDAAVALLEGWARERVAPDMRVEVARLAGRTPLLLIEIPARGADADADAGSVLLYGHLDKQPEMSGWRDDLGPWQPVIEGDRLYGRGGADDGYALFAALSAVRALREQGVAHARCVILIEACEESGSDDLPHHIDALGDRIGQPDLVVCLDSGCGNYDQLWSTTSLRGLVAGILRVEVLTEGVHSGDAGGIVPSSFRVARALLSRLEHEGSGEVIADACRVEVPAQRVAQARRAAAVLGDAVWSKFPLADGTRPASADPTELVLNRTWRPALEVTGADGLPPLGDAGNVARPATALKLSLRVPPTCDAEGATEAIASLLEHDPPQGARVRFEPEMAAGGWNAPPLADWLAAALERASRRHFGRGAVHMGEGGSIPFMGMLGQKFPAAQFVVTGVLGPHSNAHGPNEFLHLPTAKRLTCCVADVLADHRRARAAPPG